MGRPRRVPRGQGERCRARSPDQGAGFGTRAGSRKRAARESSYAPAAGASAGAASVAATFAASTAPAAADGGDVGGTIVRARAGARAVTRLSGASLAFRWQDIRNAVRCAWTARTRQTSLRDAQYQCGLDDLGAPIDLAPRFQAERVSTVSAEHKALSARPPPTPKALSRERRMRVG